MNMSRAWSYISVASLIVCLCSRTVVSISIGLPPFSSSNADPLCCLPSEFESSMLVDFGIVFIDANTAYSYINGSARIAYSVARQKVYIGLNGTELSPLIPKPEPYDMIMLYDFGKHKMYTVTGGDCEKSGLDAHITRQCIPRDARKFSTGSIPRGSSDALEVNTYQWTSSSDVMWRITASVFIDETNATIPKDCSPLSVKYFAPSANPDSGSLYGLNMHDLGPITSTDVFDVPIQCL